MPDHEVAKLAGNFERFVLVDGVTAAHEDVHLKLALHLTHHQLFIQSVDTWGIFYVENNFLKLSSEYSAF